VGDAGTIEFEKIASLRPDLIIGQYAGLTRSDYDTLSQIAPTIAQPGESIDYGVPWDEATSTIGRALGKRRSASNGST
jgi:iron complex transport system substrate-binding protein